MLKRARFPGSTLEDNKMSDCRKQRMNQKISRMPLKKAQFQRQNSSTTKVKSFVTRPYEKRGKKNGKFVNLSSSESTNPSEGQKMGNVLALKKEINEWKRQETLRSKVNEVLERANTYKDEDDNMKFAESQTSLPISAEERKQRTPETTDDNRDSENTGLPKMRNRKLTMPSVSWITVPPELSERTSMKSVADYLSETQKELPTPKRNLCLSPETFDALEKAEKLVEDAEVQISQMNFNCTLMIGDFKSDKTNDKENLYIRNIVASTIQKGFYDAEFSSRFNDDHFKSKLKTNPYTQTQNLNETDERPLCLQKWSNPTCRRLDLVPDRIQSELFTQDCLLCKSDRYQEPAKEITRSTEATIPAKENSEEKKIEEDKPEKLMIQKGPTISIQGELFVQTSKIIDIQPHELITRASEERSENVATYECRYKSCEKKKTDDTEFDEPTRIQDKSQKDAENQTSVVFPKLNETYTKTDKMACKHERGSTLMLDKQTSPAFKKFFIEETYQNPMSSSMEVCGDLEIDFKDLSLQEPQILTDLDSLLTYQQKFIQQVDNTTKKFDMFLAKRLRREDLSKCVRKKEIKKQSDYFSKEKFIKRNPPVNVKKDLNLTIDRKMMEFYNEISDVIDKNKTFDVEPLTSEASLASEPNDSDESLLKIKDISATRENEPLSEEISSDAESSKNISAAENQGSIENGELPRERTANIESVNDCESSTSINNSSNGDSMNKVGMELATSNNVSLVHTSINTETRSSAGFIENLNSARLTKESNLQAVACQKESMAKETSRSLGSSDATANNVKTDEMSGRVEEASKTLDESTSLEPSKDSTESRIESKLSEARDSLDTLLKSMNVNESGSNCSDSGKVSSPTSSEASETLPETEKVAGSGCNDVDRRINLKCAKNALWTSQEQVHNCRSVVSMLADNSSATLETSQQRKLSLLRKLESCSMPYHSEDKSLFTSTVLGDTEPPNSFTKSKGSSESSSETHSEGEVILSSSASYSQGEIRRNAQYSKANSSTKGSSSITTTSSHSLGELSKTERKSSEVQM